MPANINSFVSSFTSDVARPSRFDVAIYAPTAISNYYGMLQSGPGLNLRCESANLPGRTFGTVEQKFGSNPSLKYPIHSSYNDMDLTFIVSGDMSERTFFDIWLEYINPTTTFDFNYKLGTGLNTNDGFAAPYIIVSQYDVNNNLTYAVQLYNAYPISVNQMDLDWSNDSYHKLTVAFAYDYWQNITATQIAMLLNPPSSAPPAINIVGLTPAPAAATTTTTPAPTLAQTNASIVSAITGGATTNTP
jgi:hypothetical protein